MTAITKILARLAKGPLSATNLAKELALNPSTVRSALNKAIWAETVSFDGKLYSLPKAPPKPRGKKRDDTKVEEVRKLASTKRANGGEITLDELKELTGMEDKGARGYIDLLRREGFTFKSTGRGTRAWQVLPSDEG